MPDTDAKGSRYTFGEFTLDPGRGALLRGQVDVPLRPKSFDVLRILVERHGRLVTKDELLDAAWGHVVVTEGSVAKCLIDIRHALGDPSSRMIRTVHGRGYVFDAQVTEERESEPRAVTGSQPRLSRLAPAVVAAAVLVVAAAGWWMLAGQRAGIRSAGPPRSAPTSQTSLAVLPFADLSPERDQEYLADGIAEEILNLLAQTRALPVIARTSSFAFKGQEADVATIAARLNVTHVLEGSVRKSGSRLRITAQLIDAADSSHLWSETYDRELGDLLAVQSDVASSVVDALRLTLLPREMHATGAHQDWRAHEHFLRAQYFFNRRGPGDVEQAERHYLDALAIDPRHARSWVGLAGVYGLQMVDGVIPAATGRRKRQDAIEKALALDPNLAEAHARASHHFAGSGDHETARAEMSKALALDPTNPLVLSIAAGQAAWRGHLDEAVELQRRAVVGDPLAATIRGNLGHYLLAAGRYDEARTELVTAAALGNDAGPTLQTLLATILLLQRKHEESLAHIGPLPDGADRDQLLAMALPALGRMAEADAALEKLRTTTGLGAAVRIAEIHAYRGEPDEAFRWLEIVRTRTNPTTIHTKEWQELARVFTSPFLVPLHSDRRWGAWRGDIRHGR